MDYFLSSSLLCATALVWPDNLTIFSLIHANSVPCIGFVKKSLSMLLVGQNTTFTSPFLILSVMKNYCTSRCLVLLLLDVLPFSVNRIALFLSW